MGTPPPDKRGRQKGYGSAHPRRLCWGPRGGGQVELGPINSDCLAGNVSAEHASSTAVGYLQCAYCTIEALFFQNNRVRVRASRPAHRGGGVFEVSPLERQTLLRATALPTFTLRLRNVCSFEGWKTYVMCIYIYYTSRKLFYDG